MPSLRTIEFINAVLQYFGALFVYHVIYIESFLNRRLQREYWHRNNRNQPGNEWLIVVFKFGSHLAIYSIYFVLVIISQLGFEQTFFIISVTALTRIYQTRIFYYAIFVETIRIKLKAAQMLVMETSIAIKDAVVALRRARQIYQQAFNMACCVNEIFGYSQLALVLYSFFELTTDVNWTYAQWQVDIDMQKIGKSQKL